MFDIGSVEFLLVCLVALIVIGPKELPNAIRTVTMLVRRVRGLATEFRSGIDDMVRETGLDDVRRDVENTMNPDFDNSIGGQFADDIDPTGEIREAFDFEEEWGEEDEFEYDEADRRAKKAQAGETEANDEKPSSTDHQPYEMPAEESAPQEDNDPKEDSGPEIGADEGDTEKPSTTRPAASS